MRWYRLLLLLFPKAFRARFGADMAEVFADRERQARGRGLKAVGALWARTTADVIQHGLAERRSAHESRQRKDAVMNTFWQDLIYAARMFRRRPGFFAVVFATIALAIGTNATIFSIVRGTLLTPPPFPEPDRLVRVFERNNSSLNAANYLDMRDGSRDVFSALAVWSSSGQNVLSGAGDATRHAVMRATPELFDVMGRPPLMGRFLSAEDIQTDAHVVVISHAMWRGRLNADPAVIGRQLQLDGSPWTVVGVLAEGIELPRADVWQPLTFPPPLLTNRTSSFLDAAGRLRPGITTAQATAALTSILAPLYELHRPKERERFATVVSFHDDEMSRIRMPLLFAQGVTLFILLIGSANLVNLLLTSFSTRGRELAIRASLGAGRARLVRQLVVESLVLTVAGGLAGVLLAWWLVPALATMYPGRLPRLDMMGVGLQDVAVALGVAAVTGVIVSLGPALLASKQKPNASLNTFSSTPSRGTRLLRSGLVMVEVALALTLLAGAGLLIRSLDNLTDRPIGFDPNHALTVNVSLPTGKYSTAEQQRTYFEQLFQRLNDDPGVAAASGSTVLPFGLNDSGTSYTVELPDGTLRGAPVGERTITPEYLDAMGIPLLRGRFVDATDTAASSPVIVVNEAFARQHEPNGNVVGLRMRKNAQSPWITVVGVTDNTRLTFSSKPRAEVFVPLAQKGVSSMRIVVKTHANPTTFAPALKRILSGIDPDVPVTKIDTMAGLVAASVAEPRFNTGLLSTVAALAAGLAAIGIFGVTAYVVGLRSREFGIRLALGARPSQIRQLVLRQGLVPIALGLVAGLSGAWLLTGVLKSQLVETAPHDPLTFVLAPATFFAIGLLACWIPARRTSRLDPVSVLKAE